MGVDPLEAERAGGIEEGLLDRRALILTVTADGERPIGTVPLAVREVEVVLEATEVGEDLVERPSFAAQRGPPVVVAGMAAEGEGRVGRRTAPLRGHD